MVFAGLFWLQSMSTLPGRSTFSIRQTTSSGVSADSCCASAFAYRLGCSRSAALDRRVDLHALGARRLHHRVQAVGLQPLPQPLGHRAALDEPVSGPGSRSSTSRSGSCGTPSSSTCHCGTCSSSAARLAAQARSATDSSDHHVQRLPAGRAARARDRHAAHPVRRVPGAVLLEERLAVDAVGPAGEGHRPAGQVRQQHRRDPHVVVDHLRLGERRPPGTAPCPGWRRRAAPVDLHPLLAGSRLDHHVVGLEVVPHARARPGAAAGPPPSTPRRRPHRPDRARPSARPGDVARQGALERRRPPRR